MNTNPSFDIDVLAPSKTFRAQVNRVCEQIAMVNDPIVKRTLQTHLDRALADRVTIILAGRPRGHVKPLAQREAC